MLGSHSPLLRRQTPELPSAAPPGCGKDLVAVRVPNEVAIGIDHVLTFAVATVGGGAVPPARGSWR